MAISELKAKQGNVDITVNVVSKDGPRQFEKFGKTGQVCNAMAEDQTGRIKLTLWNEQVDQVNIGDQVHITNGYVTEWQGELQLGTGRMGKLEVVGKSSSAPESAGPAPSAAPKDEDSGSSDDSDVDEEDIEY
ncbi:DNA-binding protein [Candidatus Woesearchaeota archaeon]|nr:DNA-binding protein [Candidatus Woesearchaeota archaeon]